MLTGNSALASGAVGSNVGTRLLLQIPSGWTHTYYIARLTGAPDGLEDLFFPISSLQVRMGADPYRCYVSAQLPDAAPYKAGIAARVNGQVVVTQRLIYPDESSFDVEIARAAYSGATYYWGGRSGQTGTVEGSENLQIYSSLIFDLSDAQSETISSDYGFRYICAINPQVRPRDFVVINDNKFIVDQVAHSIGGTTATMELTEWQI